VPADALALALGAAVLHALWNVLLARTRDPQAATAAAFCMAVAIFAPVAAARWRIETGAWKYIAGSAAFELAYGILLVRGRRPNRAASAFGLSIAATIAGYTLIDNTGVTLADPLAYLEAVMIGPALVTAAVVAFRQGAPALRAGFRLETLLIAPLTLAPYALALYALRLAPAAPVAAVRETSVLFVTVLAAVMLKEHVSAWRAAGAGVVVAGVILLVV